MTSSKKNKNFLAQHNIITYLLLSLLWPDGSAAYSLRSSSEPAIIDILVLYSADAAKAAKGGIATLIDHKVAVTNQVYVNSQLNIILRVAHSQKIVLRKSYSSEEALRRMTRHQGEFSTVPTLRTRHGADMVVMLEPYTGDGICGIAWVGGKKTQGNLSRYKNLMYSHVSITACGDYVMAHELGHNMGLVHSRRQAPEGGTYTYAAGYGVQGQFTTIMAYGSAFNTSNKAPVFSTPDILCNGVPCGISSDDPSQGAHAVEALKVTAPQVADYLSPKDN